MRVTFVLPGRGGGGGAHSVIQESRGLKQLGVHVAVASTREAQTDFRANYPELEQFQIPNPAFSDAQDLAAAIAEADIAIATTAQSANLLAEALALMDDPKPRPAYYIQDYEPLFFTPGTPEWRAAKASYTALSRPLLMAKTDWLCTLVNQNHGREVEKVSPSLDHAIYHPDGRLDGNGPVVISAMIRPKTARRAPRRTSRILARLAAEFGDAVRLLSFGCSREEIESYGLKLSDRIEHLGVLSRRQVARTLKASGLFLDLSDYQAFGRTGLEGMACGCVPVLPIFGGASEYARHRENAYLVDPRSDEAVLAVVREHLHSSPTLRAAMRLKAISTALDYSIERAAFSEYRAFTAFLS